MKLLVVQVLFYFGLLTRLNAEAVHSSPGENVRLVPYLVDHLGSLYSSMHRLIDIVSLNRTRENMNGDADFISKSIVELSTNIKENLKPLRRILGSNSNNRHLLSLQRTARTNIDWILRESSRIIAQHNEVTTEVLWSMQNSLSLTMTVMKFGLFDPFTVHFMANFYRTYGTLYCDVQASAHMIYFNIMKDLITLEMIAFAAVKVHCSQNENLTEEHLYFLHVSLPKILGRLDFYVEVPFELLDVMPNTIYSCVADAGKHIKLEGLIQTVFISAHGLKSCEEAHRFNHIVSCTEVNRTQIRGPESYIHRVNCTNRTPSSFPFLTLDERPCYGYLSNCTAYKRLSGVCMKRGGMKRYSSYRIDDTVYGRDNSCRNGIKYSDELPIHGSTPMNRCYCTCHDNYPESPAIHLLNLAWSFSDTKQNKVIIGVALRTPRKMVSIAIKQGILIPEGFILPGSEEWKTFETPQKLAMNETNTRDYAYRNIVLDENTIFDLDDLIADPGYVVTGVGFHQAENQRIKLKLRQTKFDWKTGALNCSIENKVMNPQFNREELRTSTINPSPYVNSTVRITDSKSNVHYVRLQESSRKMDGGGTTVPFFDSRSVEMKQLSPIAGIGLCHRGLSDSAGFISLKLIGLNYTNLLMVLL